MLWRLRVKAATGLDSTTCTKSSSGGEFIKQVEFSSIARDDSECAGQTSRGAMKGLTMVVLETKSSLGLDCRNTERLYTGTSAHGPRLLGEVLLVVTELSVSS